MFQIILDIVTALLYLVCAIMYAICSKYVLAILWLAGSVCWLMTAILKIKDRR